MSKWQPPIPTCITLARVLDDVTIRDTPAAFGRKLGSISAGTIVRVDKSDVTLLYQHHYRYIRLVSVGDWVLDEPAYIALGRVGHRGYRDIAMLERYLVAVRDECPNSKYGVPPFDDVPEIPEHEMAEYAELELKKISAACVYLYHKFGLEQFKQMLTPELVAIMQEVSGGASTPDVEPPVEPAPDVPPVEKFPPTEPEPPAPPVVTPPPVVEPEQPAASQLAPFRVTNGQILKDGRPWKFTGVNFREIAYYGTNAHPQARPDHVTVQLQGAQDIKAQVVRFWCFHPQFSIEQSIVRVRAILDALQARGLYAILVLTDGAPQGSFFVPDTKENKDGRYTWKWIEGGYRGKYWEAVDKLTKALGSHPAVWSFEPINEITAPTYPLTTAQSDALLDFWRQVSNLIRTNAPMKLISTGNISCWENWVLDAYNNGQYAKKLALLPNIDIMTFHTYFDNNEVLGGTYQHIQNEMSLNKNVGGVAYIVEEVMTMAGDEGDGRFVNFVKHIFPFASGIMLWAVSFPYEQDINAHGGGIWNAGSKDAAQARRWHNVMGWYRSLAD